MTNSETSVASPDGHDAKTNRETSSVPLAGQIGDCQPNDEVGPDVSDTAKSELMTGLGISLVGTGIAAFVLRSQGTASLDVLSFAGRGVALYAAFQLVPFFRKHVDAKLNRTLKTMAAVWVVSVLAQGLSLATAFAKPLLISIAMIDFALRAVAFAQARSITSQLHRSAANTLVIGSIARLATGALMISLAASGATRLSTSASMIVVVELGATLLAAAFVEMSLPKHFASKTQQSAVEAIAQTTTIAQEAKQIKATDASSDDTIDVVLDLRHAEAAPRPVLGDTIVDLREHAEAVTQ